MTVIENVIGWVIGVFIDAFFNYLFFWIPLALLVAVIGGIVEWRKRRIERRQSN